MTRKFLLWAGVVYCALEGNAGATSCGTAQDIVDTGLSPDSYAPTNLDRELDAAILVTLPPGLYTLRVTGVGSTGGVALVGVDELRP